MVKFFYVKQSELSETQALLEKTEEQLLHQMDRNQDLEETTSQSGTRYPPGRHSNSYITSIQDVFGHLYLTKDDARRLLVTVKSRLEVIKRESGKKIFLDDFSFLNSNKTNVRSALKSKDLKVLKYMSFFRSPVTA